MELTKLPNKSSTDDLIELLKSAKEAKIEDDQSEYLAFIRIFDIQPGRFKIKRELIYNLYKLWSPNPKSSRSFFNFLTQYLDKANSKNTFFYFINRKAFKLHNDLLKTLENKVAKRKSNIRKLRHYNNFLIFYNIKPGKIFIPSYVLYYLYDKWTYKNKTKNTFSYNEFVTYCKLHFKFKVVSVNRHYSFKLDKGILDVITTEEIKEIEYGRQKTKK